MYKRQIDYLIIDVVFAQQTDGTRLHAQIHVFRDKDGFHFRLFGGKPVHYLSLIHISCMLSRPLAETWAHCYISKLKCPDNPSFIIFNGEAILSRF